MSLRAPRLKRRVGEAISSNAGIASSQRALLATLAPHASAGVTSSRNGRDQHNPIAVLYRRLHTLQILDVIFADEQIHKRAQLPAFIEQMRLDGRILICQVAQRF